MAGPAADGRRPSPARRESRPLSAAAWLPLLRPRLPPPWQTASLTSLETTLEGLALDGMVALEFSLLDTDSGIDISQRLVDADQALFVAISLPSAATQHLERWAKEAEQHEIASSLWVEFDLRSADNASSGPLICFRLRSDIEPGRLLAALGPELLGRQLPTAQLATLERALARLPDSARPLYFFDLSARRQGQVRLELLGLHADKMAHYAEGLKAGAGRRFDALSSWLADADRLHFSFDVDPDGTISERLGLEVSFAGLPPRDDRWKRLLDALVNAGHCRPPLRDFFLTWVGYDSPTRCGSAWPLAEHRGYLARTPSHIKLVDVPGRPLEAKGYVLFQYLDRRPQRGADSQADATATDRSTQ